MDEVRKTFRPEFINRLDEAIVFESLTEKQIRRIVDIQLDRFAEVLRKRDLHLRVTDAAKDYLGELGWDPQYGARPLKRAIHKNLEDPLATQMLCRGVPGWDARRRGQERRCAHHLDRDAELNGEEQSCLCSRRGEQKARQKARPRVSF